MLFQWFDIGTVVFLLACLVYSGLRGFVKEFFCVAAWIAGYFAAIGLHTSVAPLFRSFINAQVVVDLVSFFTTFAATYILIRLFGFFARHRLGLKHIPKVIDHSTGALMGLAKGAFFLAIFLSPLNLFPDMKARLENRSLIASSVMGISEKVTEIFGMDAIRGNGGLSEKLKDAGQISGGLPAGKGNRKKSSKLLPKNLGADEGRLTDEDRKNLDELIDRLDR